MKVLREECPWDARQTLSSLRRYTLEEVHEVIEAIDAVESGGDWQALKAELGDLLLQVAFYARIAEEANAFDLGDVVDALIDKMIYRHPHVFGRQACEDLSRQWNELKDAEHDDRASLMDGIPPLPALKYAQKQQQRAARVGFDWDRAGDVLAKMREELAELECEVREFEQGVRESRSRIESEFGDLLFTLANLARKLGLDAELCLMRSNRKFDARFRAMERLAEEQGMNMADAGIEALEGLYARAKAQIKDTPE